MSPYIEWNELARKICKRNEENKLINSQVLDAISDDEDDEEYDDTDEMDTEEYYDDVKEATTKKSVSTEATPVSTSTGKVPQKAPVLTSTQKPAVVDSKQNDIIEDGDYEYTEEEDGEESEEDLEEEIEDERTDIKIDVEKKDRKVLFDGVNVIREIESRIYGEFDPKLILQAAQLIHELLILGDGDDETTYYSYLWPLVFFILILTFLMILIAQIVHLCMRRRGERYRQALLQSKNSIIYQKLSEEIAPQTPKVHRYTPIEQV